MSAITTNPLATAFSGASAAFPFEAPAAHAFANAMIPSVLERADAVGSTSPLATLLGAVGGGFGADAGAQSGIFGSLMSSFMGAISNLLSQVGSLFDFANGGGPVAGGPPKPGQQYFQDAGASSIGDPHEAFDGTTGSGQNVRGRWDSMTSHGNLLSSDSFSGGYRVSTAVTQPGQSGVTQNARASVATDGGRSNVTMNADGSYDVSAYGRHVPLQTGAVVRLDSGESVTLNADTSLTVSDRNSSGGSIETTLRSNGSGGVDVTNSAHDVDLGGYLVRKSDADPDPVALAAGNGGFNALAPSNGWYAGVSQPFTAQPFESQPVDTTFV